MLKNWQTSLFGLAAGGFNLLANGTNWKQVALSVAVAAIGLVGKDANKSNAPMPLSEARKVN